MKQPCELLLIDGDTLVYRYGLMNHTRNVDFDGDFGTLDNPEAQAEPVDALEAAKLAISQKLQFLLDDTGVPDFRIALANPGVKCFRYGFYPQYKAHRGVPPEIIRPLRNWMRREYFDKLLPVPCGRPLETDDILGYHHQDDGRTCIVSNDKDFMTLPGWNYHPFTGELRWITSGSARATLFYQILVGDGADGFPGCPGIGPMKAEEILMSHIVARGLDFGELWDTVNFTFQSQGATEDDLKTTFCLANVNGSPVVPSDMWSRELPPHYKDLLKEIASGT
jgi:DNA polymerase I